MGLGERLYERFQSGVNARIPAIRAWSGKHKFNFIRAAILASSMALMLPGAWSNSVTVVEFAHLPSGLAAWQRGSLGIYRVCGPVSKLLYALPAYLLGVRVDYPASFDSETGSRQEWELGQLFQSQHTENYHDIYRWTRLGPIFLTLLGACTVCEWSTRLFGTRAGLVSLCGWCWTPPLLAHGSVVTSDMPAAVILILASRAFCWFLLIPGPMSALVSGLCLGLAPATKFTLLVLYPCWAFLSIGRAVQLWQRKGPGASAKQAGCWRLFAHSSVVFIFSIFILDLCYLFKGVGFTLASWQAGLSFLARGTQMFGNTPITAWLLHLPLPFPLEFLRGLDFQIADTERLQSAYLLGRSRLGGCWYWYAVVALLKVPLPFLILFGVVAVRPKRVLCRGDRVFWSSLCISLTAAQVTLAITAMTVSGTNATFRYLIPGLAIVTVLIGAGDVSWAMRNKVALATANLWLATNAILGCPDYLVWQNELGWIWGRCSAQPAIASDSLDWGQDLARLSSWASRHVPPVKTFVCAYGFGDVTPYGLTRYQARPITETLTSTAYVAVSEGVLLGDQLPINVTVGGKPSVLSESQREALLRVRPVARIGKTIRVYSAHDLMGLLAFSRRALP